MCIFVNNLETARIMLEELDTKLDNVLGNSLDNTFNLLKIYLNKLIGIIIFQVTKKKY